MKSRLVFIAAIVFTLVAGSVWAMQNLSGFTEGDTEITTNKDVTVNSDPGGGNAGARSEIEGLLKFHVAALGTMTNGTAETTSYIDDSPTGEWDASNATNVTVSNSTTVYRVGSTSLQAAFGTTAVAGDGCNRTITSDDLQNNESIGFWIRSNVKLVAGYLSLILTDDGGARTLSIGAVPALEWTWVEVDVSSLDGTTGNAITGVKVALSSTGAAALGAFTIHLDGMYKWDASDEEALGVNLVQDGVLGVLTVATAAGSANTPAALTEYTDYFVNYQSGNDVIVTITDQSTKSGIAFVNHQ